MNTFLRARAILVCVGLVVLCLQRSPLHAADRAQHMDPNREVMEWRDTGIGAPAPSGSHTWDKTTLSVTGAGAGLNVRLIFDS